jgi:hypothetical protein
MGFVAPKAVVPQGRVAGLVELPAGGRSRWRRTAPGAFWGPGAGRRVGQRPALSRQEASALTRRTAALEMR